MKMRTALTLLMLASLAPARAQYPRIANLWGVSGANKDYAKLSRYGLLILGGGSPSDFKRMRAGIRQCGGNTVLLGTAPFMNLSGPKVTPWMKPEWFLKATNGKYIQWWADQIFTPNIVIPACLDALVARTFEEYAESLSAGSIDGTFYDTVMGNASWLGDVDTNLDGKPDDRSDVDTRWHAAQCTFFDRLAARFPSIKIVANDVDRGHGPHLNGRLFEGATLLDRIETGSAGARECIDALNGWMGGSRQPGLTFALKSHPVGWQGWRVGKGNTVTSEGEVERVRTDYRRMRLGLATTLMTDAYYAYDVGTVWYGLRFWYAEYDAPLGKPLGPFREVFDLPAATILDWKAGMPASPFILHANARPTQQGIVVDETDTKQGWQRVIATRPGRAPLEPGKTYRVEADLTVLRRAGGFIQFQVRTAKGGWELHDKGIRTCGGVAGEPWHISVDVVPDDFKDYAAEWHLNGAGAFRLERLKITRVRDSYFRRDFTGGTVLLNPSRRPSVITVGPGYRRLKDAAAPRTCIEVDDESAGFGAGGGWERKGGEERFVGNGYRSGRKPGARATWRFTAPEAGDYILSVTAPGGRDATDRAEYTAVCGSNRASAVLDQRKCDGGWARLMTIHAERGQACAVTLRSAGVGATHVDALRAESVARFNDGSSAGTVALGPLDGVVLVREATR